MDFINGHGLQHLLKPDQGSITFGNESQGESGFYADVQIKLGPRYTSTIRVYTGITSSKHDLILGKPWHYDNEPDINWKTHKILVGEEEIPSQGYTNHHSKQPEVQFVSRRQFN